MSRRQTPGAPNSPAAWSWTWAKRPAAVPARAEDGWADPQRDDLPRGLAVDGVAPIGRGGSLDFADPGADLEARLSQPKTLRDHLIEQLHLDLPHGPERLIGLHLIDLVDEAGYLREPLEEVAGRLGCPPGDRRGRAAAPAAVRSARRLRPLAERMPGVAAA